MNRTRRQFIFRDTPALLATLLFPSQMHPAPVQKVSWQEKQFLLNHIVQHGDERTENPVVMMTYDDTSSSQQANQLLDAAKKHQAKLSFFLVGNALKFTKSKQFVKRMIDDGHTIGYHSINHDNLSKLSAAEITADIDTWLERMYRIDPTYTTRFARPPYGATSPHLLDILSSYGMQTILWTFPSGGLKANTYAKVVHNVRPGAIVLSHLHRTFDIMLSPYLFARLKNMGYSLETVESGRKQTDKFS